MPNRPAAMSVLFALIQQADAWYSNGLSQLGLTPVRARTLHGLYAKGPQRQRALSSIADCSPQQMNGILEALESRGWVVRNPDPLDGRATSISLTNPGWELAKLIEALRVDAVSSLFGPMSDEDVDKFTSLATGLLTRMRDAIDVTTIEERMRKASSPTHQWSTTTPPE